MYAVVKTGGRQYSVKVGDTLKVEKLVANEGDSISLDEVLYVGGDAPKAGAPTVAGAAVKATVVAQGKGPYLKGFVYKRRKRYHRTFGHRQLFTEIKITDITV